MQITTMEMDPRIAAIHYKDYRKRCRVHFAARLAQANKDVVEGGKQFRAGRIAKSILEKEDETLMESYRVMAQGQRIVNVISVLREVGLDATTRLPKLALAGADWAQCFLLWDAHKQHFQFSLNRRNAETKPVYGRRWQEREYAKGCTGFPLDLYGGTLENQAWRKEQNLLTLPVFAKVPAIPSRLRPAGDLSDYHILWEPVWAKPEAPADPILLRHVHGYIYTVLAQWDLTDIERAVLEGRVT